MLGWWGLLNTKVREGLQPLMVCRGFSESLTNLLKLGSCRKIWIYNFCETSISALPGQHRCPAAWVTLVVPMPGEPGASLACLTLDLWVCGDVLLLSQALF